MKLLRGVAALFCMITPAAALDANPASFRADPQAWVRNNVLLSCRDPWLLEVAPCNCQAKAVASRLSEADVARANEPGWYDMMRAKVDLTRIVFLCIKAQTP